MNQKIFSFFLILTASNMLSAQSLIKATDIATFKASVFIDENFNTGIPVTWNVIDGGTDTVTWVYTDSATNYGFEVYDSPYAMANSGITTEALDEILESPEFDASMATGLVLKFDQVFESWDLDDTCDVYIWDGTQWVNVLKQFCDQNTQNYGHWGDPDHLSINITAYMNANMKIRFQYRTVTPWQYGWAIDNVIVQETLSNDMAMRSVSPIFSVVGNDYVPVVTVRNDGAVAESDFDINVTIAQGATVKYNQTMNLTGQNVASGDSITVTFNTPWTNSLVGAYTLEATVIAIGDGSSINDSIIMPLTIIDKPIYPAKAYAINLSSHTFESVDLASGAMTVIGNTSLSEAPMELAFIDSTLYCLGFMGSLDLVTPDGSFFNVGKIPLPASTMATGLAYDYSSGISYISMYNFNTEISTLCILDMNNYNISAIGVGILNSRIASIEIDHEGNMFAICSVDDSLYLVNKSTGLGSPIGDLGIECEEIGQQPLAWNFSDSTLMGLFNEGSGNGTYGVVSTLTALFSEIEEYVAEEYSGFAINKYYNPTISIGNENSAIFTVYPNPASDYITVNAGSDYSKVLLTDMNGRKVLEKYVVGQEQISIRDILPGVYSVSLSNCNSFFTQILVVQ